MVALPALASAQTSPLPTLEALRTDYPAEMSPENRGALLNRTAWHLRAEGWGLHLKTGGNRCPQPEGVSISCDILVHGPTLSVYDVLQDENIPVYQYKGVINDIRNFVAPTPPSAPVPPTPPVPPATPVPPVPPAIDWTPRFDALDLKVGEIDTRIQHIEVVVVELDAKVVSAWRRVFGFLKDPRTLAVVGGLLAGKFVWPGSESSSTPE